MIDIPSTCLQGAEGEALVRADLMRQGFHVFTPAYEGGSLDLLALKNYRLYRVQVKHLRKCKDGFVRFKMSTNANPTVSRYSNIDVFAIKVLGEEGIAYLPSANVETVNQTVSISCNNSGYNREGIRKFSDFADFPINHGLKVLSYEEELCGMLSPSLSTPTD